MERANPNASFKRDATVRQMGSISGPRMDRMNNSERGASNGVSRPAKPSGYGGTQGRRAVPPPVQRSNKPATKRVARGLPKPPPKLR